MFENLVSYVMVEHLYGETFRPALDTPGYKRVLNKERRPYPSKDGFFALLPYNDSNWREFCDLVGRPDIMADPRFQSLEARLINVEVVYATLAEICTTRTNAEWIALLKDSNIPHGQVNTLDDLFVDPQLQATGFWKEVEHPTEGKLRMPDIPPRFSRTPGEIRHLQPRLGEHSVEILTEWGFTAGEIDGLIKSGATRDGR
jgi:crotonobetainyl-CoA:carnitine CoA-transferase CaiB-like acyl-CoA transferase